MAPSNSQEPCSLAQLLVYFLRLGTLGFGGPIALAGRMDRDLVEERRWVSRQDYVEGLAFSQLSPGPLAAQLAMYIGWVKAGRVGAALVAIAFVAPSFLMAVAVAAVYLKFGELPWIQHMFYGVGAAVIAIIGQSAYWLSRKTIGSDLFLWAPCRGSTYNSLDRLRDRVAFCALRCFVDDGEAASVLLRKAI